MLNNQQQETESQDKLSDAQQQQALQKDNDLALIGSNLQSNEPKLIDQLLSEENELGNLQDDEAKNHGIFQCNTTNDAQRNY